MALSLSETRLLEPDPQVYQGDRVGEELERLDARVEELREDLDELAERFEAYNAVLSLYESRLSGLERLHAAASMIGAWKASTCVYSEDGVCKLWRLRGEAAEKLRDIVVEDGGVYRVAVSKAPWFCALCPLYRGARAVGSNP